MRDLMLIVDNAEQKHPMLTETVRADLLYHGTSIWGLVSIVKHDAMYPSDESDNDFISFSRNFDMARRFAAKGAEIVADMDDRDVEWARTNNPFQYAEYSVDPDNGAGGAVIGFDREMMKRRFGRRLQPYADLGFGRTNDYGKTTAATAANAEMEERIVGDVTGIAPCIARVFIIDPTRFAAFERTLIEMRPDTATTFKKIRQLAI